MRGPIYPHTHQNLFSFPFFSFFLKNNGPSNRYEKMTHCDFHLHSPLFVLVMLSIFTYACWVLEYLVGEMFVCLFVLAMEL